MESIHFESKREPLDVTRLREAVGRTVTLRGSIYKIRKMSGFCFVILRLARYTVQCVCDRPELIGQLQEEACAEITAEVVEEPRARAGAELHLTGIRILTRPTEKMPVVMNQKKLEMSLETRLDYRPLTLRNEKERAVFRIQAGILRGFRSFLEREGFTEIHSPKIVSAGAEGGANIFRLDYFGREAYLAQSPQFYKQMMVGVFERVYEVGPVFRAEKHDTARHLNEYTGVDFEMGYLTDFRELMEKETGMLRSAIDLLREEYRYELELLEVKLPEIQEIPAIRFSEAKAMLREKLGREPGESHDFEPQEEKLLSEILFEKTGSELVFVTHYPTAKRPFYAMEDPENPEETLSFDLIFRGLEITTGGQRIHDYPMQVEKMRRRNMRVEEFESFLMMHRYGMPPHGGLGLGLERFTARLLGFENVRAACLFPRDMNRLTP
ncbi:MAG: aspartate--tRNA(Asn) ligase [Roseburia sp.]|nr:aspartate--tRNA(Asn) ligase [Roseburia sp.]MCM1098501.1 aspartate--tRNA(Asn) ligase [Ruminococcus flavefaciens]